MQYDNISVKTEKKNSLIKIGLALITNCKKKIKTIRVHIFYHQTADNEKYKNNPSFFRFLKKLLPTSNLFSLLFL